MSVSIAVAAIALGLVSVMSGAAAGIFASGSRMLQPRMFSYATGRLLLRQGSASLAPTQRAEVKAPSRGDEDWPGTPEAAPSPRDAGSLSSPVFERQNVSGLANEPLPDTRQLTTHETAPDTRTAGTEKIGSVEYLERKRLAERGGDWPRAQHSMGRFPRVIPPNPKGVHLAGR